MAKGKNNNKAASNKAAKDKTPVELKVIEGNPEAVIPADAPKADLSVVQGGGTEPPTSALEKRVISYMEGIAQATTTQLHALAVECMEHASKHKDLRPLLAMQNHMPKSLRKLEFARWVQAFGPVEWGKKDAKDNLEGIKMAKEGSKHFKEWNIAGAQAVAFYDAKEADKPKGIIDAVKQLMSQNKTYEKLLADPSIPRKDGVTDEQLQQQIARNNKMIAASAA